MKKLALILLLTCSSAFAQSLHTFSLAASPISLPNGKNTLVGTSAGMALTITQNFDLRQDDVLAGGGGMQFYGGGFNYRLPVLSNKLNNVSPTLSGPRFQFYITASAGVDRLPTAQHYGFLAGGGINYDLSGSGTWTFGGEVRYAKLPGYNNNTAIVSLGPAVHF